MTRNERLQGLIRLYKEKTGNKIIDMDAVTEWSLKQGVAMPKPKTPKELFAAQLSDAARAEFRRDAKTGLSYRANHAMRKQTKTAGSTPSGSTLKTPQDRKCLSHFKVVASRWLAMLFTSRSTRWFGTVKIQTKSRFS